MAETRENPWADPRLVAADRIGKPRINQIANASDVRADCKVLREIGRKPGSIIDQEISRLVSGSRRVEEASHRGLPGLPMENVTQPWKCKLLVPSYRVPHSLLRSFSFHS